MIDSHWHMYIHTYPDGRDFREVLDQVQKEQDLEAVNLCCIPCYEDLGPAQNILGAIYKLHNPTAYAYGGLVYPDKPLRKPMPEGMDPLSQYRELMDIGFDGIKMLETKPSEQKAYNICVDDPYFDGLFAACERDGTHMIWHVADPEVFWDINRIPQRFLDKGWFYGDGTYLSYERTYGQVYNVLDNHPNLSVTFAHFFFLSAHPERLETLFAKYPNTSVDLTPGAEMHKAFRENYDYYRDFFIKYADRVFLGTDTSHKAWDMTRFIERCHTLRDFVTTDQDLTVITTDTKGMALPKQVSDKILGDNFRRVAGAAPKKIDRQALRAYVEKYKHLITDQTMLSYILKNI